MIALEKLAKSSIPTERYRLYPIPGFTGQEIVIEGADRTPDEQSMQIGILESMGYPMGGSVAFEFEANKYFDAIKTGLLAA